MRDKSYARFRLVLVLFVPFISLKSFTQDAVSLAQVYKDYFLIGVAVTPQSLKTDEAGLILSQFNSLTAENAMKMGPIHPQENEYLWAGGDSIAAFAQRHGLKMRGHTLCWHNQVAPWMFKGETGDTVTKEILMQRLKDHITTVVSRYKDQVYAWDVVNEVISDSPGEFYRPSIWYKICGEEFISKAFEWAHAADPDALLFYNDYNETHPVKREKIFQLVKNLKESGVPIHGVGLQGHWSIYEPTAEVLEQTLDRFSQLGLQVQVTELDISVYAKGQGRREPWPKDSLSVFTPQMESLQIERYKTCFDLFRKYRHTLNSVTFWNISDRRSWLDYFPVRGRKDYPLLFDKDLKPKKAFWPVVNFQKQGG